jgi:signal transduction histidine kinase/DNA-binding response OmpR family regulator
MSTLSIGQDNGQIGQFLSIELPDSALMIFLFGAGVLILTAIFLIALFKARRRQFQAEEKIAELEKGIKAEQMARHEADQTSAAKSAFLATMSHEIRTPMNGILGMTSLLKQTSLTGEQKEYLDSVQNCGDSLLAVINDILDYSKIEAGKMEVERNEFNLRTCIEEVLDIFASKASKSRVDLSYQIDLKVPTNITGDSLKLRQVITNLVGNAMKFTQQGEVSVSVYLESFREHDAQIAFTIRDTGIGIPSDKLGRLFKSFSQVDSSTTRKFGGTGLGLVICEKLVGLMGGNISVSSEVGKGSVFSFNINVGLSADARKEADLNTESMVGKKILLVGEHNTTSSIIQTNLRELGSVVEVATSGKEGLLAIIENSGCHMVIADMQLQDMDGMQFASRVRQEYAKLPIILLSGLGTDKSKGRLEPYCTIVSKPVKFNALVKQMIKLVNGEEETGDKSPDESILLSSFAKRYPLNILIADDNAINQKLAVHVLNKLGYKPEKASDGEEAYQAQKQANYDLILMDAQMPVLDGLEATKKIRQLQQRQPVIIATTASAMAEDRNVCLEAGMDDYLSKPLRFDDLLKILEKWAPVIKNNVRAA